MAAFFATLRQFQHAFAATLGGQFELDVLYARARGYDTALEAYLDKDNLPTSVHDNLITAVNANLEPLHRYVELRRKVLGLDDLHIYDLYVPMVAAAEMDVPYAEAIEILPAALAPLGPDYVARLKHGPRSGQRLDRRLPQQRQGQRRLLGQRLRPPSLREDELPGQPGRHVDPGPRVRPRHPQRPGHGAPAVPQLPLRAVPGRDRLDLQRGLLSDYLVANAQSKAEKAGILAAELESIRTTIYRQTLFSEFERLVHGFVEEGTPITATLLDETYADLVQRYYGPGFTVDADDGMEWAYIPHFYYKYYVYSYATGLSCGLAIAERVKEMGQPAVDDYLGMLKGGCSRPPWSCCARRGST